jgi:mannose-6-phosphate isomerase-like protein (cupin superfamily)
VAAVGGIQTAHATLTTTTADTVTLTGQGVSLAVTNHDASEKLWFTINGATAVALADENFIVLPGNTKVLGVMTTSASVVVSVVGNGNVYSVEIY